MQSSINTLFTFLAYLSHVILFLLIYVLKIQRYIRFMNSVSSKCMKLHIHIFNR